MSTAVLLMRIGGALAALGLLTVFLLRNQMEKAIRDQGNFTESQVHGAMSIIVTFAVIFGLLGTFLWFWMAQANGEGRQWARTTATVFFAFSVLGQVTALTRPNPALSTLLSLVQFGIGLAAIILMYRPESSRYYEAMSRR